LTNRLIDVDRTSSRIWSELITRGNGDYATFLIRRASVIHLTLF